MKKYLPVIALCLCFVLLLVGCGCNHEWAAANCESPKTCELCSETQGEAKGHSWVEATCTTPKTCSVCHTVEGETPGHAWEEATTETPKTCTVCKTTEGSKIESDPRFTTESTKIIQGKWVCDVVLTGDMLGMPGYFESLPATLSMDFGNAGDLICNIELHDNLAFLDEMKRMLKESTYAELEAQGISNADADTAMKQVYGMNMEDYLNSVMDSIDLDDLFAGFTADMVYYVGQNGIYCADSWLREEFECSAYTLENDILIMEEEKLEEDGEPLQWKRAAE